MNLLLARLAHPRAIAMWDFSWLERRWPGAGYENPTRALDELAERGYDAVRIDAYPHLVSADSRREWELLPCWSVQDWGSPALNRVRVQPHLDEFLAACAARGIAVGLSSWYREDRAQMRLRIRSPEEHADQWIATVQAIDPALRARLLFVDLCNEWPLAVWAPFFPQEANCAGDDWGTPASLAWMRRAVARFRDAFPGLPVTFSTSSTPEHYLDTELPGFDLIEAHLWMANATDFYRRVGYSYERFSPVGYENVVQHAEALYRASPAEWQTSLHARIDFLAECGRRQKLPLITTEGWAIVDYKDWPLLDWGWVKELTALGAEWAAATGRWAAIATSNFCGPQFHGMWSDIAWHQRLTHLIRHGELPDHSA
ncbi:MAG TPA: cellulase-like family protein [Opitutaceae bacterium]|nr:cellulase-like family protein [Opitutaceae bacterium]